MLQHEFVQMEMSSIPNDIDYSFYRRNRGRKDVIKEVLVLKDDIVLNNYHFLKAIRTKHQGDEGWVEDKSLNYYGVTLLTEESILQMLKNLKELKRMQPKAKRKFRAFCQRALEKKLCIVHFGI